jgi:23S rRNA (adenine-N6)-dimethyltransferase
MARYLHAHRPTPRVSGPPLSQHFLRDPAVARDLVSRLHLARGSLVVEPGPGRGAITGALVDQGYRVFAVEKDPRLRTALRAHFGGHPGVECHHGDILAWPLPRQPYAVVSNVPFAITADLVRRLLDAGRQPEEALLIVQQEAAERFTGHPRQTRMALLHLPWSDLRVERAYHRTDFDPPPSVDCVLLRIDRRAQPLLPLSRQADWTAFVERAFGARRQEARDSLRLFFTERQLVRFARDFGFDRRARPSEIPFGAWLEMFRFHTQGRFGAAPEQCRYRNRSFSAGRISIDVAASSDAVYSVPRTMATGTRASLPCTSSAAAASSSTTAICVTRSS